MTHLGIALSFLKIFVANYKALFEFSLVYQRPGVLTEIADILNKGKRNEQQNEVTTFVSQKEVTMKI
jgi:hypothetical protein